MAKLYSDRPPPFGELAAASIPAGLASGYGAVMPDDEDAGQVTPEQRARVAAFIMARTNKDTPESLHVERSGIPQSTWNAAASNRKLGLATARRIARYFGWGEDVSGFLNGTEPAGHYASREEGLPMGYPNRGMVLDRFRGVVSAELLEEIQRIELPTDVTDWPPRLWAAAILDKAREWSRLGKPIDPSNVGTPPVGGQGPKGTRR